MNIREKIQERASEQSIKDRKDFNRSLVRMSGIIIAGYIIGTVIAMFIERR